MRLPDFVRVTRPSRSRARRSLRTRLTSRSRLRARSRNEGYPRSESSLRIRSRSFVTTDAISDGSIRKRIASSGYRSGCSITRSTNAEASSIRRRISLSSGVIPSPFPSPSASGHHPGPPSACVRYLLVGGYASVVHAVPRTTLERVLEVTDRLASERVGVEGRLESGGSGEPGKPSNQFRIVDHVRKPCEERGSANGTFARSSWASDAEAALGAAPGGGPDRLLSILA